MLHYITLHYITLHYITLHYITLHYITLHYITLHYITITDWIGSSTHPSIDPFRHIRPLSHVPHHPSIYSPIPHPVTNLSAMYLFVHFHTNVIWYKQVDNEAVMWYIHVNRKTNVIYITFRHDMELYSQT